MAERDGRGRYASYWNAMLLDVSNPGDDVEEL